MLAGVIFDFDGVIIDSHPAHLQAWKAFLLSKGKNASDAELSLVQEGGKREEILRYFFGDLTQEQITLYGIEKDGLFQARASDLRLIPGFLEFLAKIDAASLPSAVATSGSRRRVEQALAAFNLRSRFRDVVTGDDVARGKPDPALFLLAAQAIQVDPECILVCEDAIAGVIAAKAAGMNCLAIAADGRSSQFKDAGADVIVPDFSSTNVEDVQRTFR